jgi:AbrB family looped-hinge helix DNA binding protein
MKALLSKTGQITLPAKLRKQDNIASGDQFEITRTKSGEYRIKRVRVRSNQGFVASLLACPAKGWFRPMDRSETTDDLPPPDFS